MSAHCWWRRRRNKYLRPYLNYLDRHPDRVLVIGNAMLSREGVANRAVDYVALGSYQRARIYLVRERQ